MTKNTKNQFHLLPVAAAILLAYGNAYAADAADVPGMITPSSVATFGVGFVNNANDAKRFSEYTGLNKDAVFVDLEVNKRDNDTGKWLMINARNLGLDTQEFRISNEQQGNWKIALDYNEMVRRDPYIINTGMTGIGTANPTINLIANPSLPASAGTWGGTRPTSATNNTSGTTTNLSTSASPNGYVASNGVAGNDVELQLKRTAVGFSGEKRFSPETSVEISFRNEEKKGARMFGRAGLDSSDMAFRPANATASTVPNIVGGGIVNPNGGWAVLLTPEPINSTTKQLEGKVNYSHDKLAVTGGYYGSFYNNSNGSLSPNVPGALNRGTLWTACTAAGTGAAAGTGGAGCSTVQQLASSAVALPPDNQAHQLYVSGNYAFTDTTRSTFKVAYTKATQNESYEGMGLTAANGAPASLNGEVDTTLVQLGLTMKPMQNLSVNGSLRYEDRADKTQVAVYNTNGLAGALNGTTNWPSGSQKRTTFKLDGIYRLSSGYSLMVGGDLERKIVPLPPSNTALFNGQVLFRHELSETGVHAELRKALSETLNGAIGMESKQRRGKDDDWKTAQMIGGVNTMVPFDPAATTTTNPAGSNGNRVLPDMYMDRDRSKVRANLDWEATEKFNVQAVYEHAQDNYLRAFPDSVLAAQTVPTEPGARKVISDSVSLDASYQVTESWRASGFWTQSQNRWNVNKASLGDDTKNTSDTMGLGVDGKVTSKLSVGMNILSTRDKTTFKNTVASGTTAPGIPNTSGDISGFSAQGLPGNFLPNIYYTTNKLNAHAKYALDKISDLTMFVVVQEFKVDDWQWGYNGVPFVYSDNTTVSQPTTQRLQFVGMSYGLKF